MMNDFKKHLKLISSKVLPHLIDSDIDWTRPVNIGKLLVSIGFEDDNPLFIFKIEGEPIFQIILVSSKQDKDYKSEYIFLELCYLYDIDEEGGNLDFENFESYIEGLNKFNTNYDLCLHSLVKLLGESQFDGIYLSKKANKFEYNQEYRYNGWKIRDNYLILQQDVHDHTFQDEIGLIIISVEKIKDFDNLPVSRLIGIGNL